MVQKDWGPSFKVETLDTPRPPHNLSGPPENEPALATGPPQDEAARRTGPPQDGRTGPPREVGDERVVVVHACPYNSLLRKYDALHLVAPIFCRADALLFEKASGTALSDLKAGAGGASFSLAGTDNTRPVMA